MSTTTRLARILVGYVTIGIVFGIALTGSPCGKGPNAQPDATQAISKPITCDHQKQAFSLLSYVSYAARSQSLPAE